MDTVYYAIFDGMKGNLGKSVTKIPNIKWELKKIGCGMYLIFMFNQKERVQSLSLVPKGSPLIQ